MKRSVAPEWMSVLFPLRHSAYVRRVSYQIHSFLFIVKYGALYFRVFQNFLLRIRARII